MTPLYFAFPDGVFDYVCAECDPLCCRGQGFMGSLTREVRTLVQLYPSLESMAISRWGNIVSFATPRGRCHFLEEDNLCRIEKEHGKAIKPGVCVLFPFNSFALVGKTVVVSPHFMCPLRVRVPAEPGAVEGTHSRLEDVVRQSGLLDPEYLKDQFAALPLHSSDSPETALARESRFRDQCSQALGQQGFYETLAGEYSSPGGLEAFLARAAAIMGIEVSVPRQSRDAMDDLLLALAPPLRVRMLSLGGDGLLRALALGELVLRRVALLSNHPLTLQGAHQIVTTPLRAFKLLARGDEPLELPRPARTKAPSFGNAEMSFAAFIAMRELQSGAGVLTALEKSFESSLTVTDRSALLIQLGTQVEQALAKGPKNRSKASS